MLIATSAVVILLGALSVRDIAAVALDNVIAIRVLGFAFTAYEAELFGTLDFDFGVNIVVVVAVVKVAVPSAIEILVIWVVCNVPVVATIAVV